MATRLFWLCVVAIGFALEARADDWPRFRGVNGAGVADASPLPDALDPKKNLLWRTELPPGRSSPIVVGDRVYVTGLDGDTLVVVALDRATGAVVWRRDLARDRVGKLYTGNDTASSTPVSDGEYLYVFFADLGLVSFDRSGNERWRLKLGPFDSFYGVSASPVVHGNTVALVCDQRRGSFAVGVDRQTGRIRWRVERKAAIGEGYATPAVHTAPGQRPQLVVSGPYRIDGYDLETGESLWWVGGQGNYPVGSPVLAGDLVFAVGLGGETSPYPRFETMLADLDVDKNGTLNRIEFDRNADLKDHFGWLDADDNGLITRAEWDHKVRESVTEHGVTATRIGGTGDRTASNSVWRYKRTYSYLITPLVYRDVLYLVKNGGIITSLDPRTGQVYKTGRTRDEGIDDYFSSPVAGDGKVFLVSHTGKVTVLEAGREWAVLSIADLDEPTQATPAIAGGRVFIRTEKALYSFGPAAAAR
jgi:outer membrane protein assembly factor BamB